MAYWDQVINSNPYQQAITGRGSNAFAAQYPIYDQSTPQYPSPSPYATENMGYRLNELVYACIQRRADAISEAPSRHYLKVKQTYQEIENSKYRKLIERPCEGVTEAMFHGINEIYLMSAGFSCWEKERNRAGEVINLWPMRPDWCSFLRGNGRPLRAVRYQPYGLPPVEIPRENILYFEYFDPLFPLIRGLAPVAVGLRTIGVDNAATEFLKTFFQRGSVISGILSSEQSINDVEADRIKQRWRETHGGVDNWSEIAVLGAGSKYQPIGTNFKDMAFTELDGRSEARICAIMKVPPILVGAKVGLNASTMSNYREARGAFYEETVTSQWNMISGELSVQLLPEFDPKENEVVRFDTRLIKALQDNRNDQFNRAINAAKQNILTRDEARAEIGYDPIDNDHVFVGVTLKALDSPASTEDIIGENNPSLPEETPPVEPTAPPKPVDVMMDETMKAARDLEKKQFRQFAQKRAKEGHPERARNFIFKHTPAGEQAALFTELPVTAWRNYP